jgi:hypothetical protein
MNQFGLEYIYTWKCHKETPCVVILNKNVLFFFIYKIREQEGGTGLAWGQGWYQWKGEGEGKGWKRVNMVQILCTHVCKWKTQLLKLFQNGERRDKGEWWWWWGG